MKIREVEESKMELAMVRGDGGWGNLYVRSTKKEKRRGLEMEFLVLKAGG